MSMQILRRGKFKGNGEWIVDALTVNSTNGHENHNPKVIFTFYFHRTPTFYVILIIMPSFALTFLCVIGMFWSRFSVEFMEKLGLGFTVILAMCSIFQMMENSLPKTTQLPALSVYMIVNLLLVTASISINMAASKACSSSKHRIFKSITNNRVLCFNINLCTLSRAICLSLFPLAAVVNLLILLL
ncbi:unnamed protein product [Cylicocyclus nassatus]|uniref:Neurotransmitter-gated ion-channel transmembrane domain-containing protein n=1 Tax=Cylicocyclus nassatus TaxID=53992 RepID=A0AA36M3L8_CYLNA|nr:unnamed protein product [Cylicocyclus nassatus]